jgi:Transcriptional regulator containing PAS, AAA-type ATPase, and DNA-binding domains
VSDRKGHFEAAHGGTLFLDEIGELPLRSQVKLLRILQEGSVVRVGESRPVPVEVRVVAATNRNLLEEVAAGRFRSDLYYRLAVAVLHLPPLRERPGDVGLLLDHLLRKINEARSSVPGYRVKSLSPGARNVFLNHSWPGNVRELHNTLLRAAVWTDGPVIRPEDAREALVIRPQSSDTAILGRPLSGGLDLRDLLETVARHYLERAMKEAGGNKSRAKDLVGLPSPQTLTNWLKRYGLESS